MSQAKATIESAIKNIHQAHGLDDETLTQQVIEAVGNGVAPLESQITDLQGQVANLQKALQDTVKALKEKDTAGALATASAALPESSGDSAGSAGHNED
jgi:DNA anti-recombination protein RmuC